MLHDTTHLLQVAYRTAARIVRNPLLAEEAGERAVHRLLLESLSGHAPAQPEAWIRTVARRSACAILRNGWARTLPFPDEDCIADEARGTRSRCRTPDEVRSLLQHALTRRQTQALDAALTCPTTKDAARSCGMQPRDFRRYLAAITRRAHRELERAGNAGNQPGWQQPASGG